MVLELVLVVVVVVAAAAAAAAVVVVVIAVVALVVFVAAGKDVVGGEVGCEVGVMARVGDGYSMGNGLGAVSKQHAQRVLVGLMYVYPGLHLLDM